MHVTIDPHRINWGVDQEPKSPQHEIRQINPGGLRKICSKFLQLYLNLNLADLAHGDFGMNYADLKLSACLSEMILF